MSDITSPSVVWQQGIPPLYVPRLENGFWYPTGFTGSALVAPNSARAARTYIHAIKSFVAHCADQSYATFRTFKRNCIIHDWLACGRTIAFEADYSCCWGKNPLDCTSQHVDPHRRHLLLINNELEPVITRLVPKGHSEPFERYKDILALLCYHRSRTQHPDDHADIDYELEYYLELASQPLPTKGVLL